MPDEPAHSLAVCRTRSAELAVLRRLSPAEDLGLPERLGADGSFTLLRRPLHLRCPGPPLPEPAWVDLLRAVETLQKHKFVHRCISLETVRVARDGGRYVLVGWSSALDVKKALRRGAFYPLATAAVAATAAPELKILGVLALTDAPLTAPLLLEAVGAEAFPCFARFVGAAREPTIITLVSSWKTWDLYSLASLFPKKTPVQLACVDLDPCKRPKNARLAAAAGAAGAAPTHTGDFFSLSNSLVKGSVAPAAVPARVPPAAS